MPSPTTVKPMTEPEAKATRRPRLRLFDAALAVRELAWVEIFIPIYPASMEKMPPERNANGVNLESIDPLVPKAMSKRMTKTIAKILATVAYCCFR